MYCWLQQQLGSSCIVCCHSGNGAHILIRLPNRPADAETAWVCERFLLLLSAQFINSQAKVDTSTHNAARICTLYGTVKRKGSDIPERPHRPSKILHVPDPLQPVDWAQLAALVDPYPGNQPVQQGVQQPIAGAGGWNIDQLLEQHELEYSRDDQYRTSSGELATRWELEICPFNHQHNDRSAYLIQWHNGARTSDKAAAERIAARLEADVALRRDGVIDPTLDAISKESQRSIGSHLADYEAKFRAANRTDEHVNRTVGFVRKISEYAGFVVAADISADAVNRYAGKLRDDGRSARTIQAHLTAIKGFSKWLTEHQKLPRDPLASVRKPNPKADRRRERRMLLPEEWHWLQSTTTGGPVRYGMTGAGRVLLYQIAIETALRSSELRSLTRGRLFLEADLPYVTCKAGSTKNRKMARQFILTDLAADLRAHIATKAPKALVFDMPDRTELAAMLRADLADARRAWLKDAKGDPDQYARREQSDFLKDTNHDGEHADFVSGHKESAILASLAEGNDQGLMVTFG